MPPTVPKRITSGKKEGMPFGISSTTSVLESSRAQSTLQGPIDNSSRRSILSDDSTLAGTQQEVITTDAGGTRGPIDHDPLVGGELGPEDNEPIAGGRGNRHLGDTRREKAISTAFSHIWNMLGGSEQELYGAFDTDSREEIIEKCFISLYALGLSAPEIAKEHGVSHNYVLSKIPDRRHPGYKLQQDEGLRKEMVEKAHTSDANERRGKSLKKSWKLFKEENPEAHSKKISHMNAPHLKRAAERRKAAFGDGNIKKKLRAMVDQGMNDDEIGQKTGFKSTTIKGIRNQYGIKLAPRGHGVTDEEREITRQAIDSGYSATLNRVQEIIVFERLRLNPPRPLREVGKETGLSAERVNQIAKAQLKKIKKFVNKLELPDKNKTDSKGEEQIRRKRGRPEKHPVEDIPVQELTRGNLMRLARTIEGKSLHEMSEITGLSYSYICAVETGNLPATDYIANIYEKHLKCLSPGEILSIPRTRVKKDNETN